MSPAQRDMLELLPQLKGVLPNRDYAFATEAAEVGEEGVALHCVCAALHEDQIRFPRAIYVRLEAVGKMMEMPPETWEVLAPLVMVP